MRPPDGHAPRGIPLDPSRWLTIAGAVVVFLIVFIRTAWVCDDAFITYRTVDNFVNGYGLRWNPAERVQSFTHPLWMMLVAAAYAATREPYYTSLALSIVLSLAALVVYGRWIPRQLPVLVFGYVTLLSSKSFIDFSTSGLENPLTHLLVIVFLSAWFEAQEGRARPHVLTLSAGLTVLNRLDSILLLAPALVTLAKTTGLARSRRPLALGFTPLAAWMVFSLAYYGFPFPNTAYAKLQNGVARDDLVVQGLHYYADSFHRDPVTLLTIAVAVVIGLARLGDGARPIVAGVLLYGIYVVTLGGDFMSGRFLSASLLLSVGVLTRPRWPAPSVAAPLAAAFVVAVAAIGGQPMAFATGSTYGLYEPVSVKVDTMTGVDDERRWYYPETGLLRMIGSPAPPAHAWAQEGRSLRQRGTPLVVSGFIGFTGYFAGPAVHIVDCHALSDPLLARLPASPVWRVGHFTRQLPAGYLETLATGDNALREPAIAALYGDLKDITTGPIWTWQRIVRIMRMNLSSATPRTLPMHATEPSTCDAIVDFHQAMFPR